jgi:hypothetical protein
MAGEQLLTSRERPGRNKLNSCLIYYLMIKPFKGGLGQTLLQRLPGTGISLPVRQVFDFLSIVSQKRPITLKYIHTDHAAGDANGWLHHDGDIFVMFVLLAKSLPSRSFLFPLEHGT